MASIFSLNSTYRSRLRGSIAPSQRVTGEQLKQSDIHDGNLWYYDQPGTGIRSNQQYNVDWENFENHVFFNSAESKVNLAFDRIINGFPFDGTSVELEKYLADLSGYDKYILDNFPTSTGSINFVSASNHSISLKDRSGYLFLGITKNKTGRPVIDSGINSSGFCFETWLALPEHQTEDMFVFQAKNEDYTGISIMVHSGSGDTALISALISSGSTTSPNYAIISGSINRGEFTHIAINYDRGENEKLEFYKNGVILTSSISQAEISGTLRLSNQNIYIGTGSPHTYTSTNTLGGGGKGTAFSGSLDEFRMWSAPRTRDQINNYIYRNVFGDENLKLYYRFNEPSTTGLTSVYSAKNITLDYSGNGLHGIFNNYSNSVRDQLYSNPMKLERPEDNPVLFPDYETTISLNQRLLLSGTHYDSNNPNMIIKLVPDHYFREGKFFEGIENEKGDFIASYEYDGETLSGNQKFLPGRGKIPHSQVMTTFLLIWASFFDDMKLHVDQMTSLKNARHNYFDTIPLQFMPFLAQYYGIELPNPFQYNNPLEYHKGFNLTTSPQRSQNSLLYVLTQMWNRLLTELPYVLRSKGTIQSVRSLLGAMGIDAESSYRLKEYGGSGELTLDNKRIRRSSTFNYLDFSTINFVTSSNVAVYRHEPGVPFGGPAPTEVLVNSGDIKIVKTSAPVLTQITSASWSYEANYKMKTDANFLTQSLWRLEALNTSMSSSIVLNLLAMRNLDEINKAEKLKLLVSGSSNDPLEINVDAPNFWDGTRWYVNVNHNQGPTSSSFDLRVKRSSIDNVLLEYEGSQRYLNNSSSLYVHFDSTNNPNGCYWAIGSGSNPVTASYLASNVNDMSSSVVDFKGKIGSIRLWSKSLSPEESREHSINIESVGVKDPRINYNFTGDVFTGNLGEKSTTFDGTLPEGSWERLRTSFQMYQTGTADSNGKLIVQDVSQNNLDLTVSTVANSTSSINKVPVLYSSISPYWDISSTYKKVRVRSYQSKEKAIKNNAFHGSLHSLDNFDVTDDRRFGIEASAVQKLNEDIVNIFSDMKILNNFLGAPEMEYSLNYPDIDYIREKYFRRLTGPIDYNALFKFFKWFNLNVEPLVESMMPKTVNFLGVNFVIESHMLERNKFEYKQGDVHVDINARKSVEVIPIFIGDVRMEIT